ncbi:MAG TPA: 2,3-bisphosphoglycerate-independent phosphoglycerate mutase [Vicinamibacterales bacterium]|nr:2,3-bisphosphoglycerate-independent phosphoglycerate mutase [Vicinamibacterales bacterium]
MTRAPLVLLVLDGFGIREAHEHNAIRLARTPVYDALLARYPHAQLVASGEPVGLPAGQMGNSEVGHTNMGAGRIVYQDLTRIDKAIRDRELEASVTLQAVMSRCADGTHALHFVGLVSDGGVHSHQRHLHALIELAAMRKIPRVFVHMITDGRDASPMASARYIPELEEALARAGNGRIATMVGRYYAMDRDQRWERTKLAHDAIIGGVAERTSRSAIEAAVGSHAEGVTDEFIKPVVIVGADGTPVGPVRDGDSLVFFNFRADRARQITRALALDDCDSVARPSRPRVHCTTMTMYDRTFGLPVVFDPQSLSGNFADVLAEHGRTNLRLAETEKYAHVTYFFNCGREEPYPGEDRILVPSQKVATYDLMPEMSAQGIADALVADIATGLHDVVICNFANADMVGHSGSLPATIAAVETLDRCLGQILHELRAKGGTAIVTSDHGNAEQMWDGELNAPHTAHTSNPVPVILCGERFVGRRLRDGSLRDVAPTMLELLELAGARDMTGANLID